MLQDDPRPPHLAALGLLVFAVGISSSARADNGNPNVFPLGENEPYLGNTGIGRADDTGAVYYNPSGLTELPEGRITVSGSAYLTVRTHADGFLNVDNTNVPFDSSGFVTVPSLFAATRRLGDWIGALSVLVPETLTLDNSVTFQTPNSTGKIVYSQAQSELWIGLSAAHPIGKHWSAGLTVFGIQHHSAQTVGVDIQNKTVSSDFASSISQLGIDTFGLAVVLGVSYVPTDWLRFGLRAQSPLWQLYGQGSSYETNHIVANGMTTTSGENVQGQANTPMPFDFGFGTAINPWKPLTLLVDVSLQIADSYSTFPTSTIFNEMVTLNTTPRLNAGLEVRLSEEFTLRAGGFYNPSTRGGTPGDANYSHEDYYGFSGGIGYAEAHVRTSVGGYFTQSSGSATPVTPGTTSSITNRGIAVLLTTAYVF